MKQKIMILFVVFLIFPFRLNADIRKTFNEVKETISRNNRFCVYSIPFYKFGNEGVTIVKEKDIQLYKINEYFEKCLISNNGQFLVLYSDFILKSIDVDITFNSNLFSIYKNGSLIKSYKIKDLFAFNSDLSESISYCYWLNEIEFNSDNKPSPLDLSIEIINFKLRVKTINGISWVIDLNTGEVKSKDSESIHLNTKNSNLQNKKTLNLKRLKVFKDLILKSEKFDLIEIKCDEVNRNGVTFFKYFALTHLMYKGSAIAIEIQLDELEDFKINFPILVNAIKSYVAKNSFKNNVCNIKCYVQYSLERKMISGFYPNFLPNIIDAMEIMTNTFLVRKCSDLGFLDEPFLIKYCLIKNEVDFNVVKLTDK